MVGNARDGGRIPALSRRVDPGQTTVVAGVPLEVLDTSGHTLGQVAWATSRRFEVVRRHGHGGVEEAVARLANRPALFVGDALFGAGCGRLFEGTREMLTQALKVLAARNPAPSEGEVRHWLEGNLCRCTGYHNIVKAVRAGAGDMNGGK